MIPLDAPHDLDRLRARARAAGLEAIAKKVLARERLDAADALELYRCPDPYAVGMLANHVRERMHGDLAYFNVNQHINYTNVCNKLCRFCAFQRLPGQEGAYIFSPEQIEQKLRDTADEPVTEVHMVAGIYPRLPYEYYLDILRAAKRARPDIHVKAFTMIELMQIARRATRPAGGPARAHRGWPRLLPGGRRGGVRRPRAGGGLPPQEHRPPVARHRAPGP